MNTFVGLVILFSAVLLIIGAREPSHYTNESTGGYINDDPITAHVCCICLEDIDTTTDKKKLFSLPCRHIFHRKCLKKLFEEERENRRCPYCRRHIHENVVSQCV